MTRKLSGLVLVAAAIALAPHTAGAQARVSNLRIAADDTGAPLQQAEAPPGEKRYHLDTGTATLFVAFDCASPAEGVAQVRVMQPPGSILFQEDSNCAAGGTQVVVYDREGEAFSDNEYVVNLYVGEEDMYLADSVQFAVGEAEIPESQGDMVPTAVASTGQQSTAVSSSADPSAVQAAPAATAAGGPSKWLLAVAGIGILGLVGVVAWAGWSAVKK